MKKFLAAILSIVLIISLVPMSAIGVSAATGNTTEFAGGSGTEEDPYLVKDKYHLDNVRFYLSSHFKMVDDIVFADADFSEGGFFYNDAQGWEPIGYTTDSFTGVFDGNGFAIHNLKSNRSELYTGFFGTIANAIIRDVYLADVDISGTTCTGGIAGRSLNSFIENCGFEGSVHGEGQVGGIVGSLLEGGCVSRCLVIGEVFGENSVAGICGYVNAYEKTCTSKMAVVTKCFNDAIVQGQSMVGGVVGYAYSDKHYTTQWVQGTYGGASYTRITGYYPKDIEITNCYNTGEIKGDSSVGGILGYAYGSSGPYSDSSRNTHATTLKYCYNSGAINSEGSKGPIASSSSRFTTLNTFYFQDCISGSYTAYGNAKTHNQMRTQSSFTGFDFNSIWTMAGSAEYLYPELQAFALSGTLGIKGNAAYLSTVEPDLSGINKVDDTFIYEWFVNDVVVATTETYKLQADDIGKKLKLKVKGTRKNNQGILYSDEVTVSKAIQIENPVASTVVSLNDNKLEITTAPNQEYSIDNVNWQSSGVFDNLDPNKDYTVYSRILENDLYLLGESVPVLNVTTNRRPLTGSVNMVGTSRFGDTLTADVSAVGPDDKATYRYEWKRGDEVVGTNSTYTIVKEDIDQSITLSVIGTDDYIGTLVSAAVTATKALVQMPNVPAVESKTNNTVKLLKRAGYEYSKDKIHWQASPLFEGLAPNTEYTFYQRVAETETEFASKSSNGFKVTTLKNTVPAPAKPVIKEVTNNSVTLERVSGYEYSLDGFTWQASNVFTGLSPNMEYSFCQRVAETEIDYVSAQSGYVTAVTLKNTVNAPSAPVVESATDSSVTLTAINGYEYSKNGTTWQKSNVFNSLEPLETYIFYQRVAETDTDYASEKSEGTSFKVKFIASKPAAPVLVEITSNKIVVETKAGYQYSIDGVNWRRQGMFTGLNPNTTYSVYCRMTENDDYYASANSNPLKVTTLKSTVSAPPVAPIVSSKTDVSVTLRSIDGYEYRRDGSAWQSSNVFRGLSPNTEYTFYQRIAETDICYAGEESLGVVVTTYKKCEVNPQYHIYTSDCDTHCNECGAWREVPDHIYDNACDDTCNVVNCGFVRTVGEHEYNNACDVDCNICGTTRTVGDHAYDNNCDAVCNICFAEREVGDHKYTNSCDTTCDYCGAVRAISHTYTNDCDTTCNVCGATRTITHTYSNICDAFCNVCSAEREVGDHKYTNSCDTTCDYCDEVRAISHTYTNSCDTSCNVCSATRAITHSYKTTTTKATLSKNGSVVKKCAVCGKVESNTAIKYAKTFKLSTTCYAYNGKVKTPSVTVKDSAGKTLKKNTDYTVTYASGRKNVGTYKVTIKMKGKYSGSKTLTFTIKPTVKTSTSLLIGGTSSIGAKSNKKITYSTSSKSVATVSSKGVITAKKAGTATISVKSNGITQKIKVTVKKPYVKISGTKSMLLKKSVSLKATSNTSAKVKWSTSNSKIATVSSSGKVTGQKAGSATIYAKITYKGKTYTGKYTVTVKKPYLKQTSATIDKGKSYQISVVGGSGTIKYTSSNKSVATVSSKGIVKGIKKGTATITVKRNGYSMKFTVKVNVNSDKEILAAYAEFVLKNVALKNPSTYQVNNYIYQKTDTGYVVYVWYSAANGFGGMIDGYAMARFDDEQSGICYSVTYGNKYILVLVDCGRPSTFDGYIDADAVDEEYDKIGTINYYRPKY